MPNQHAEIAHAAAQPAPNLQLQKLGVNLVKRGSDLPGDGPPDNSDESPNGGKKPVKVDPDDGRKIIRTGTMDFEVNDFDAAYAKVKALIAPRGSKGAFMNECWGTRTFSEQELAASAEELRSTPFKKLTHNFLRFNVCPGTVDSPSWRRRVAASPDPEAALQDMIARQPMGRVGTPEEIAALAAYLVSDEAAYTTGTAVFIDGGLSL